MKDSQQGSVCYHPYFSRRWIGYSGYFYCSKCKKIVMEDK